MLVVFVKYLCLYDACESPSVRGHNGVLATYFIDYRYMMI